MRCFVDAFRLTTFQIFSEGKCLFYRPIFTAGQQITKVVLSITNDETNPTAALWRVIPTTAPQDAETTQLVNRLRDDILPTATAGTGLEVAVAGSVAINVGDFEDRLRAACAQVKGAYSLVLMTARGVYGLRDPNGWRPLDRRVNGHVNGAHARRGAATRLLDSCPARLTAA